MKLRSCAPCGATGVGRQSIHRSFFRIFRFEHNAGHLDIDSIFRRKSVLTHFVKRSSRALLSNSSLILGATVASGSTCAGFAPFEFNDMNAHAGAKRLAHLTHGQFFERDFLDSGD